MTKRVDYENPWMFGDRPFTDDDVSDAYGFVYLITDLDTDRRYIGRKYFTSIRKRSKKAKKRERRASDWKSYYGSSEELLALVEERGPNRFRREILSLHATKGDVNMNEVREQFLRNVLEDHNYVNANIAGRWYPTKKHIIEGRRYPVKSEPSVPDDAQVL